MTTPPALRAVLDTNLVIRLLITPYGITGRLLTSATNRAFRLVTSELLIEEVITSLQYPRLQKYGPYSRHDLHRIEGVLRRTAVVVPGLYRDLDKVPTDVKDNMVVACALEAGAQYIVTDDRRDLLPLKVIHCPGFQPVQIVRPAAFLRLVDR